MLPQGAGFRKMASASSTEKALLLAHHPFRADRSFPGSVALQAQEAILEEGLTELLLHQLLLGQDCGGNSWLMMMRCFGLHVAGGPCLCIFSHHQRSPGA